MKSFISLIALLVGLVAFTLLPPTKADAQTEFLADYVFTDWDGKDVYVADYRGKIVIIDLWERCAAPHVREHFLFLSAC